MPTAAFFDLDRTLLVGASGPVISEELRREGLLPERHVPGEGLLFDVFNLVGETLPGMLLTRQAARAASGWPRVAVQRVGRAVVEPLLEAVAPFAKLLISEHQEAGRPVVMATTTPYDVVKPFADALGLDDVVATRYGLRDDGTYDGSIDGEFVWGRGKLLAVKAWCRSHGVELRDSWAYSDSFYDLPLRQLERRDATSACRLRPIALLRRMIQGPGNPTPRQHRSLRMLRLKLKLQWTDTTLNTLNFLPQLCRRLDRSNSTMKEKVRRENAFQILPVSAAPHAMEPQVQQSPFADIEPMRGRLLRLTGWQEH